MRALAVVTTLAWVAGCGSREPAPTRPPRSPPPGVVSADAAVAPDHVIDAALVVDAALPDAVPPDAAPLATIVDWPVPWPPQRDALMIAYRQRHSDPSATDLVIEPRLVVLHYTGGHSAKGTHGYMSRTKLEEERAALRKGGEVNVVSHFVVDRDGTIYRLIPETRMGRHAIGVNHIAIGVENVGDEKKYPLTDAQVTANVALIRDLAARFPIERVVGHHEVAALRGTPWYVERVRGYRNAKGDPGARFMAAVRAGLGPSPLATPP
jgi:hypothetical protein